MKKILLFYILFLFHSCLLFSQKFEFTPININFNSIESKGDTIAVLGDLGSMLISYDNAETWEQKRVFDKGKMVKLFFIDSQMLAFSDMGQISTSIDNGKTWKLKADLNDSVFAVVSYPVGYFLRSDSTLFIISNDYHIKNKFPLLSKPLGNYYNHGYKKSIAYFNNYIIAAIDSSRFLRFDLNLSLIDTVNFSKFTPDSSLSGRYEIEIDSNYFYAQIDSDIYRTEDFSTAEMVYKNVDFYKFIGGNVYKAFYPLIYNIFHENFISYLHKVINKDSSALLTKFDYNYVTSMIRPKDFIINRNKYIFIGDAKLIIIINLDNNETTFISDFSGGKYSNLPDRINDSTYLFYDGFYDGTYYNEIYLTKNNGLTLQPTIDININPNHKDYFNIEFKYFDDVSKTLYMIAGYDKGTKSMLMISKNYGRTFTYKQLPEHNIYYGLVPYPLFPNAPNLFKRGDNFILASNTFLFNKYNKWAYNKIITYNEDFDLISEYRDSNYVINYIYSKDTNSFIIHCINFIDTTREFRYTSDKGLNWEVIMKYPNVDSMLYYKEITIDDKPALAMFLYNESDSFVTIEILDFETKTFNKIYTYKVTALGYEKRIYNGIFRDSNYFYIAIQDTLFFTKDIYDKSKWRYVNFPYNGKIIEICNKYGDTFFARYSDDIHPNNIYWIKISDMDKPKPIISVVDYEFGKRDIKSKDTINAKLKIENLSSYVDLTIKGYSIPIDTAFTIDLPLIDSLNPLLIKPREYFEFNVYFKPNEVKVYIDSIVFYSNADDIDNVTYLSGEGIDTTTAVIDVEIEVQNYLYAYPPFPMPAKNYVKTLIYWDMSLDIDKDEIVVFNIYGEKIEGREKIRIDRQNLYSGWLVWDCSVVESGIYFIKINHGTRTIYLKVMVDR
ncbi:MAG: hypothetical protein HZB41_01810 [Ignavibacteriae bacterium]|nr:hypothetical protein [Ignavibacteriota bacterium]